MRETCHEEIDEPLFIDVFGYARWTLTGELYHRWVARNYYEWIPPDWIVHHVDGDKLNNEPLNLIPLPRDLHDVIHRTVFYGQRGIRNMPKQLPSYTECADMLEDWCRTAKKPARWRSA